MQLPGFAGQAPFEVFKKAIQGFVSDDMMTYAAALAFRVLLALFPFLIFLLTFLGALGLTQFFDWLLSQAQTALPADAYGVVERIIGEIRGQQRGGLLSFSILFAIWAASAGVRSLMNAINVAYDVEETRPAWQRYLLSVVYTIGLAIVLIAATGLMVLGPDVMQWLTGYIGLADTFVALWSWLRWPVAVLLLLLLFALIYKVTPNIDQPLRFITPGSVLGVLIWILASIGFSFYVSNFGNYGATYGSLGGIIVLLLYFFLSAAVLLFGAEINAVITPANETGDSSAKR